jgi:hypothetical protein
MCLSPGEESAMNLTNLNQPPLNTTMMGVVRGVSDFFGRDVSTPWLYGASGHAFVANVHEELCPSGPYCWRPETFDRLLRNLGLARTDHGFYHPGSTDAEKAAVETGLRAHLERGLPCSLANMENQLITGLDETGFLTTQPWPGKSFPPAHLTFGTWAEFEDEFHVNFFTWDECPVLDERAAVVASLEFALDMAVNPAKHTSEAYGIGPDAWRNWIAATKAGLSGTHGNWWNAIVWSECRTMASTYFAEVGDRFPEVREPAQEISKLFAAVGKNLEGVADKEKDSDGKLMLLLEIAELETEAIGRIPIVAETLLGL